MTVRYSHLAPDFMADAVEKLVPEAASADSTSSTVTRTDTDAVASITPESTTVH
jgi:hypothetical protein